MKEWQEERFTKPKARKGYYVDEWLGYEKRSIYFVNEAHNICKLLVDRMTLVDFPGYEEGDWLKQVCRLPVSGKSALRVEVSRFDEQGNSRILIYIQWHDTPDETGFGMENIPEIILYSILDEYGNYLHPYRLYKLSY